MKHIKRNTCLSLIMFLLLVACHNDESVAPGPNNEFIAGKLASVMVAEDYEVSFWETSPGNLMMFQDRTVDADMVASKELKEILKRRDAIEIYKKLTGTAADPEVIKKIAAAQLRSANPIFKDLIGKSEGVRITSSLNDKAGNESARVQAPSCQERKNGKKYFVDNYVTGNNDLFTTRLEMPPFAEYMGPMPAHQTFSFIILNGQKLGSGNNVIAEIPGIFGYNIPAWHIVNGAILGPGQGGLLWVHFPNNLQCATTHIAIELFSE